MKTKLVLTMALCPWLTQAQVLFTNTPIALPVAETAPPAVVEIGPHHRVWQSVASLSDDAGNVFTATNSYVELATGLNFLNPLTKKWEESDPRFEITPKGDAVARKGQHQVALAANINSAGSVDLLTPDGKRFLSNPMGLSLFDTATGTNVLVAEVKECIGQFIPPNVILYDDAFTDIKGAIRYTYTRAGLEQDVLIYDSSGLGSPAEYGLNPSTSVLEMYTEFHEAPAGEKTDQLTPDGLPDESLHFGQMDIGAGKAFGLGTVDPSIPVAKSWQRIDGRTFLIESVRYPAAKPFLDDLQPGGNGKSTKVARSTATDRRSLIASDRMRPRTQTKAVASIQPGRMKQENGFVIDYITLNTGQFNYIFRGDITHFITDVVNLDGKTVFESGAVIKYDTSSTPSLWVRGTVDCQGSDYRPIVLTGKDDNTVGEVISGSTGLPTSASYGNYGIVIDNTTTNGTVWSNLRFTYLRTAFQVSRQATHTLYDFQIVGCDRGIMVYTSSDVSMRNVLIDQVNYAIDHGSGTARGEHLTIHRANNLKRELYGAQVMYLTNCLAVGVTNVPTSTNSLITVSTVVFTNDVSSIFQTVGAGSHYLADNTYRNVGTTIISASLWTDLKRRTTFAPILLTNDFTTSTTLSAQVQRDGDIPDLGFHYSPIDYCLSGLNLTNSSTLLLTNAVAVAFYGTNGITIQSGCKFISEGTPVNPNRLVRYSNVQEQPLFWGSATNSSKMLIAVANPAAPQEVRLRFTQIPFLAVPSFQQYLLDTGLSVLALTDCQVQGSWLTFPPSGGSAMTAALTNNLMDRCQLRFEQTSGSTPYSVYLRNNLLTGGLLNIYHLSNTNTPWALYDNFFNSPSVGRGGTIPNGNNAYYVIPPLPSSSGGDITLTNAPDFVVGPLGNYYYPTNGGNLSRLIDAGSRTADQAGLYHYTVRLDQTKEANSVVDIGCHFVAVGSNSDGLVGWWRLDDAGGTLATDSSGYGHGGTLLNGPTWTTGQVLGALNFDGANDYVSVADSPALRIAGDITIAFWTKKNAEATLSSSLVGKGNTSVRNYEIWEDAGTGKRLLFQQLTASGQGINLWTTTTLEVGTWYHVAAVVRGTNAYFYINGTLDNSGTRSISAPTTTDPVTLGYSGWNDHYPGLLDEVRIYNRALTADEIAGLASLGIGRPWDTDGDGAPDYLEDKNGNGVYEPSSGESNWTSQSAVAGGLQVFTPLK